MAGTPVITYVQAARIHAQVWVDDKLNPGKTGGPRDKLDKDPGTEINNRKSTFGILPAARLVALELYNANFFDIEFDGYDVPNLASIIKTGNDLNSKQVIMKPSLWIAPSGTITPITPQSPSAISLPDWARIYAYIWFQLKSSPPNTTFKDDFEMDPASALQDPTHTFTDEIIDKINNFDKANNFPGVVKKIPPYTNGGTPLVTHGDPPPDFTGPNLEAFAGPSLQDISDDPNALGYRYIVRFSC